MSLLDLKNLSIHIGSTPILKNVTLSLSKGEILGLVGESGSGKSMTALSVMQLLPEGTSLSGEILFDGTDLAHAQEKDLCALRGRDISMVFQEPMTALNPVKSIVDQVAESLLCHERLPRLEAYEEAQRILARVGLDAATVAPSSFPHQLSGGQRQRVVIAIAIACRPRLLIADEPTTALDVTIQAQILDLLKDIVRQDDMAMLLISHDLAVVADMADRIAIMQHGEVLEQDETLALFRNLQHPYSRHLLAASAHVPRQPASPASASSTRDITQSPDATSPLLVADAVTCTYPLPRQKLLQRQQHKTAVDNVHFRLFPGQSLGLVGESGCGKSTLARTVLGLKAPTSGYIQMAGQPLHKARGKSLQDVRRSVQAVFQDPYGSFDPRCSIFKTVGEPLHLLPDLTAPEKRERVTEALTSVGLAPEDGNKFPHEFSGGQRQRIAIARALVTRPRLIIADEPVSALDVSIRAQILDLFAELQAKYGLAYLFISHDLSVVRSITERVMVMKDGRIVEEGKTSRVFDHPAHPYTQSLLAAAPDLQQSLKRREAALKTA